MKEKDLLKRFKKESKNLNDIRLKSIHAQEKYDNEKTIGKDEKKRAKFHEDLKAVNEKEDAIRDVYARKIFEYLSQEKPILIRRRDKTEVPWLDAFGTDFEMLSVELKASIVALVEQDGGQYRIKF